MYAAGKLCIRKHQRMKIHQIRWCTLNKLEIRYQYVTNTLQYVGIRCHMTKWSQNVVLFYTFDIS